jgi:hypothetical protein
MRDRIVGWIRGLGFPTLAPRDGVEAVSRIRTDPLRAAFLEREWEAGEGTTVWRMVRPIVGRRLVLMAWERTNDLWFEALRAGVGALMALPAEEATVRAALKAVTQPGAAAWGRSDDDR